MLYGQEKAREIARSVLPSTRRRSARIDLAHLKRSHRRRIRQTLHDWVGYDDPLDFEGHIYDYDRPTPHSSYWGGLTGIVDDRRNGDKLGALLRWAPAVTAHLDNPEDRYMAMKAVLGDNLIGRHALSHLAFMDVFDFRDDFNRYRWRSRDHAPDPWSDPVHIEHVIREILASGWHKDLNRRLGEPFTGLHELEAFIERIRAYNSPDRAALISTWDELNTL